MDNLLLYRLVEETQQQARFAQFAFQNLRTNLQALDSERVFFFVHAFLSHAANISGLLWPARPQSADRGEQLRAALKTEDNSVLRLREFRHQLHQYDERLEDWAAALEHRHYMPMNIMPQGTISDFKQDNFHRNLDPENLQFALRGDTCNLRALSDEVRRLETAAEQWLKTHNAW